MSPLDGAFARSTLRGRAVSCRNHAAWYESMLRDVLASAEDSRAEEDRKSAMAVAVIVQRAIDFQIAQAASFESVAAGGDP